MIWKEEEIRHHPELCVEIGGKYPKGTVQLTDLRIALERRGTVPRRAPSRHQNTLCPQENRS